LRAGDGTGFAFKAGAESRAGDFDCDIAAESRIVGAVDSAHAAFADFGY
jgi:hypothetical protein